jgi:RNA polymerase sigma-70 factor (ECF subfamily)
MSATAVILEQALSPSPSRRTSGSVCPRDVDSPGSDVLTTKTKRVARNEIDQAVVRAAVAGDREAFAKIVRHYDPRLRVLAFQLIGDATATDDALQDAYIRVFRGLASFGGRSALGTWLYRVTYTTCIDHLRKRKDALFDDGEYPLDLHDRRDDPGEVVPERDAVGRALAALPHEQRAAVLLVDAAGMTFRDGAEALGLPLGTFAARLAAARAALRVALGMSPDQGEDR